MLLITTIKFLVQLFTLLVLLHVILSYFLSPFHPIRNVVDRIVEPILNPIRQAIPTAGMFDFSPLILLILIQILGSIIINLLRSLL